MEIIRLVALILSLSFLLISCSPSPTDLLSYQEKSFRAHLSFEIDSLKIGAVMTSHDATDTLIIEFNSPPSLAGITVKKCGEECTVSLGDLEISSNNASRFAELSKIFEISGTLKKSSVESLSGIKFNRIELFNSQNNEKYVLYLYKASGLPRKITAPLFGKEINFDIFSFELF